MKKTLGIIGCGSIVSSQYVSIIPHFPGITDILLTDLNPLLAQEMAKKLGGEVTSTEKLIAGADIILIATPLSSHYALLKQSLQPGKMIVCEKPFLQGKEESEEIAGIAESTGAKLFVAHVRRIFPATVKAREIVKTGMLGGLKSVQLFEGNRFSYETKSRYIIDDPLGGVLYDTGSHIIDQALFITGWDEKKISAGQVDKQADKEEPSHELKAKCIIRDDEREVPLSIYLSRKHVLSNKLNLVFEHGTMEVPAGLNPYLRISGPDGNSVMGSDYELNSYEEAFQLEYDHIFDQQKQKVFSADRFISLCRLLESIHQTDPAWQE